jgi:hypothetical protein
VVTKSGGPIFFAALKASIENRMFVVVYLAHAHFQPAAQAKPISKAHGSSPIMIECAADEP